MNGHWGECWPGSWSPNLPGIYSVVVGSWWIEGIMREGLEKQMREGGGDPLFGAQSKGYLSI